MFKKNFHIHHRGGENNLEKELVFFIESTVFDCFEKEVVSLFIGLQVVLMIVEGRVEEKVLNAAKNDIIHIIQ